MSIFVLFATRDLKMTSASVGMVYAAGGFGGAVGAYAAGHFAKRWSRGRVLVTAPIVGACGGAILLLASGSSAALITAMGLFFYSLGETSFGVNMQTCRQEVTPTTMMGRMDTTMRLCFRGMASLGALSGGYIASRFGVRAAIFGGVVGLCLTVMGLNLTRLKERVDAVVGPLDL